MKRFICLCALVFTVTVAFAQDEGVIEKKERFDRANGIFLSLGPSVTLGKNIGDYSTGFNFELGYLKRVNRVLSLGPSLSYLSFQYDPEVTDINGGNAFIGEGDPNFWGEKYGLNNYSYIYGYILNLEGGDLGLTSLAFNFKFNIIPVMQSTKFSVYAFAKPFVTLVNRSEVTGSDVRFTYENYEDDNGTEFIEDDLLYYDLGDDTWYPDGFTSTWGPDNYEALKSDSEVSGGIFIGPGVELFPNKKISAFLQASFGYTFPVTFISTSSYENLVTNYVKEEFPMVKKGFPSVNIQFGASYNF